MYIVNSSTFIYYKIYLYFYKITFPVQSELLMERLLQLQQWKSWKKIAMFSPGIEPGTFCVLDRCDNRYTTKTCWGGRRTFAGQSVQSGPVWPWHSHSWLGRLGSQQSGWSRVCLSPLWQHIKTYHKISQHFITLQHYIIFRWTWTKYFYLLYST